jgi:hypothetical protein
MQRANRHAVARATTSAETEALVAPVLQLVRSADEARMRGRLPRALELSERALALAETTLPESTLLTASLLEQTINRRLGLAAGGSAATTLAMAATAWRSDEQLMLLSQRLLGLLRARWAAGTLLTPTPEELCFVEGVSKARTPELLGVELFAGWAVDALTAWPEVLPALAGSEDCLHGIHETLRATLAMQSMRQTRSFHLLQTTMSSVLVVLHEVLFDAAWLHRLRSTCGLSQSDETELRKLYEEAVQGNDARGELGKSRRDEMCARAAADVARHGLRSCALPSCNSAEPAPKSYKLCGRCRGAAYCCAAHSKEDWKRHKREDGCAPPP